MAIINNNKTTNAGEDAGKKEPLYTVCLNVSTKITTEISMEGPHKNENKITI
jgi:hypothetical protein